MITSRPNRDAVDRGLGFYIDAMRPYMMKHLMAMKGPTEQFVRTAVNGNRWSRQFNRGFSQSKTLEELLEPDDFRSIIQHYWRDRFHVAFKGDHGIRHRLGLVAEARNEVAHVGSSDLDIGTAVMYLTAMSQVLYAINAPDARTAVDKINEYLTMQPEVVVTLPPATLTPGEADPETPSPGPVPADTTDAGPKTERRAAPSRPARPRSGRQVTDVKPSEIRETILLTLAGGSCKQEDVAKRLLQRMGIVTRGKPREDFERKVERQLNSLEKNQRIVKYQTAKNRRVRLPD